MFIIDGSKTLYEQTENKPFGLPEITGTDLYAFALADIRDQMHDPIPVKQDGETTSVPLQRMSLWQVAQLCSRYYGLAIPRSLALRYSRWGSHSGRLYADVIYHHVQRGEGADELHLCRNLDADGIFHLEPFYKIHFLIPQETFPVAYRF